MQDSRAHPCSQFQGMKKRCRGLHRIARALVVHALAILPIVALGSVNTEDATGREETLPDAAEMESDRDLFAKSSPANAANGEVNISKDDSLPLSPFVDTRLSFSFSDDDLLAGPGDTRPNSPGFDMSARRANRMFFENLDSQDSGYETMTHLVLYRRFPGFHRGFESEVALVVRMNLYSQDETGKNGQSFYDDGSYIKAAWYPSGEVAEDNLHLSVSLLPFNADRFRLGYLWDLTWGDQRIFPAQNRNSPGAKLQMDLSPLYVYFGAKSARLLDESVNEMEGNLGFLGGAGIDLFRVFNIEACGGYFNRGTNPLTGVEGKPFTGYGGSARAVLHLGTESRRSLDFRLYKNDPATTDLFLLNSSAPERKTSFHLTGEYTILSQSLQSGDDGELSEIVDQYAHAAAITAKLQLGYFDLGADFIYRDLAFVLFNRPSFVPFQAFPSSSLLEPEYMLDGSVALVIPPLHTTFAVVFGFMLPSTFTGTVPDALRSSELPDTAGSQTVVVRNAGSVDILPCKEYNDPNATDRICLAPHSRTPIYALRGVVKYDFSSILSFSFEATAHSDGNQTDIVDDEYGQVSRRYVTTGDLDFPLRVGVGLFAQARF